MDNTLDTFYIWLYGIGLGNGQCTQHVIYGYMALDLVMDNALNTCYIWLYDTGLGNGQYTRHILYMVIWHWTW